MDGGGGADCRRQLAKDGLVGAVCRLPRYHAVKRKTACAVLFCEPALRVAAFGAARGVERGSDVKKEASSRSRKDLVRPWHEKVLFGQ